MRGDSIFLARRIGNARPRSPVCDRIVEEGSDLLYRPGEAIGQGTGAAFLDEACAGDEGLRRQIDQVPNPSPAGGFLEHPVREAVDVGVLIFPRYRKVGPFRWKSMSGLTF